MYNVIMVTVPDKKEARKISEALIRGKYAACVNIILGVESLFWWEGKVDSSKELLLFIKSTKDKTSAIIKKVKSLHSYKVPEIISLKISAGSKPYLNWIDESVR